MDQSIQDRVKDIWWQGVNAVKGDVCVKSALSTLDISRPDQIIAIGKASSAMLAGAQSVFGSDVPSLLVTKYAHSNPLPGPTRTIEAAHPVPDDNSLLAGKEVLQAVQCAPEHAHLLMLVSGGASSLVEVPANGMTLADAQSENAQLLSAGLDIHAMNRRRAELSQIKGGKLLTHFKGASVTVLAISDVEGDDLSVIGSGIGQAPAEHRYSFNPYIVASNAIARGAAAAQAQTYGLPVVSNSESLYCDVFDLAAKIGVELRDGPEGLYIWGGEPTIALPPNPGQGGRNQALALALAEQVSNNAGIVALVAGTDGTDGPTDSAGAMITDQTWMEDAREHLRLADSGTFLDRRNALFTTGPTGTNVMDLIIAAKF